MNCMLEEILSSFFRQYDFSQKKYINAVFKGILLGTIMFLLFFCRYLFQTKFRFQIYRANRHLARNQSHQCCYHVISLFD